MILSMTGFGDAALHSENTHYAVEIRSLNNRYFKSVIKLPESLAGMEPEIEVLLREKLGRGSITFILKLRSETSDAAHRINTAAIESYLAQLQSIPSIAEAGVIDVSQLLMLPGVCQEPADDSNEIEKHGQVVRELTQKAVEKLRAMREREGAALHEDLMRHLAVIESNLADVEKRAPDVVRDYHKRVTTRVNELIGKAELRVGESELIRELAVFAERSDVSEEIQRLRHHCGTFRDACTRGQHAGRKLDFITQEMLREANTIGSKAADAHIAGHIVEIKGSIDRLKEQVQNVE